MPKQIKQMMCGQTALHIALLTGNADMVKLLLDSGAEVNAENEDGRTPLYWAAEEGHEDIVKLLLEHGTDPNITNEWGRTPLYWAAEEGHEDIVKLLLEHGTDPNITNESGRTPLCWAAEEGHEDIVKLLLERGADPNITNKWGRTPLYWAAYEGHEDIVKLLLEHGADPNITYKWDRTPLHVAAGEGHEDVVKLLLEHGADPNNTDKDKETAHDMAVKKSHEHVKIVLHRYALPPIQAHLLREMIMAISDHVSLKDVRMLARAQLGIPDAKLDNIEYEYQRDAQEQSFQILWLWKVRTAGATVHNLFQALKDHQLNACLDKVRNQYSSLLNEIWSKPEDEFQKFSSSLQRTQSSTDDVTLSNMTEMNLKCYVSEDLESLYVPLESFNANAKVDDNDSNKAVVKYRLAGKGVCRNAATFVKMTE
ncbi:ankyrin-1-like [Lingula anatina]|uniref:Ankyrin-1-like n=1 Tax=Lingula anatina TaxID=7574 RepID=A0A1S3HYZ1_LINAN|nr:ankyrin-1-like [Lingula anatina]|eukprot:XP_013391240.1 ankyrin-1-like [Lingula anatina]